MATPTTLVSLNATSGEVPEASVVTDGAGDLFGTTTQGGTSGDGTVFEIAKTGGGYAGTPTVLVNFNDTIGQEPASVLLADEAGNLFGTTIDGGTHTDGTVFEIVRTDAGYASLPTTLVSFNGTNGGFPYAGLFADAAGDLFGTTAGGGIGNGEVFEIAKAAGSFASTPTTVLNFNGTNGETPKAGLIADAAGDLFGTTELGGANSAGTVFEIAKIAGGYASSPTVLVNFNGTDGANPYAGLVADAAGNLFGTTFAGGANNDGTVFEIAKTAGGYASSPTMLVSFNGTDGASPHAGLIIDAAGDLFGTTYGGGTNDVGAGTVFEIANTAGTYASTPVTLVSFNSTDGAGPFGGLIADAAGDLFGTTDMGGTTGDGTIFELTDTGFQVACYRLGTRIATPVGERAAESLAVDDLVLTVSGEALPIIWIGHRHIDCRRHPQPEKVWPVRVRAGTFGEEMPRRDLWLSPDHAVFVDAVLIPIKCLINDTTIEQVQMDEVTYYHVELSRHEVLYAEGMPAESYLETGNRFNFEIGDSMIALHCDFGAWRRDALGCAPLIVSGAALRAARRRVSSRAATTAAALAGRMAQRAANETF